MILRYFLGAEAFAIIGFLLGNTLFPKRFSLIFYKFFGLTIMGLLTWYLSLATGETWTSLLSWSFFILLFLAVLLPVALKRKIVLPTQREWAVFLGVELISFVLYMGLVYIRTFKPEILGTEKLMDVALINALLKYDHIPVANPWLSGFLMNYYYFGHFLLAMLQYVLHIPSSVGYNLAISLVGVWIVQAAYLVGKNMKLNDVQAMLLGLILTFGGNVYLFFQGLINPTASQWFASATRVIPYTINEFPSYSVILGDLHGHYLSYPFFLVGLFLLLDIFFGSEHHEEHIIEKGAFLGLLLGHLYLTNSWDVLTLGLVGITFAGWYVYLTLQAKHGWTTEKLVMFFAKLGAPLLLFSVPQFLWSRLYYLPPVGGIGINTLFSPPVDLFFLFGQFLCIGLIGCALIYACKEQLGKSSLLKLKTPLLTSLFLVAIGIVLVILVEFFYAKDVFTVLNAPYARNNTVFKIYFHVWALFALGVVVLYMHATTAANMIIKKLPWLYILHFFALLVFGIMASYPYASITQYLNPTMTSFSSNRLLYDDFIDGYSYIKIQHAPDDELIAYLATKPYSVILESADIFKSYSYFARISAYTGHSAVSGWPLHNVQWYNGYDGKGITIATRKQELIDISVRAEDIKTMYTDTDPGTVLNLLQKYSVQYVIFGDQETTWANDQNFSLNQQIYDQLCTRDWEKNGAIIYKCN